MKTKSFLKSVVVLLLGLSILSCKEKETLSPDTPVEPSNPPQEEVPVIKPVVTVEIGEVKRTEVTFSISSDSPGDYAWTILPAGQTVSSSEELFENGSVGMFEGSEPQEITYTNLEGGKEYNLYAAVRKLNPYVYSELSVNELSTEFIYEDVITMEKITPNAISYHIEMPEDGTVYKHMIVDYNDYLFFHNLVGVTYASYLSAFGHADNKNKTFSYEWHQNDVYAEAGDPTGYVTYFYSDTKYVVIAGPSSGMGYEDRVSEADVKFVEFTTPKAEVCPHEVKVDITDIKSLEATLSFTPEEGVARYRVAVFSEEEYDSFLFEGEEMVRRSVIGPWDDTSREFTSATTMPVTALMPQTRYYVCIMVFDEDMRELYIEKTFTTTEPIGPAPEISVEATEVTEPWNSASVILKLQHAVSAVAFVNTKEAVENVLNAPGNEDVTMDMIIRNNGDPLTEQQLAMALSAEGCKVSFEQLQPKTEYVYAVQATNDEYVTTSYVFEFTTEAEPIIQSPLFAKLKGEYTAVLQNIKGEEFTFDVTITDGVNDATREEYAASNLLVCLGFDPSGVEYHSPQDLLDKGWATDEETANKNYGPKWFLEIDENDNITTYKHTIAESYYDPYFDEYLINYSMDNEAPMASFNGTTLWFKSTYERLRQGEMVMQSTANVHDVDFDEEAGTITVKRIKNHKSWSDNIITEYPGVVKGKNWYSSLNEVVFCGGGDMVLTRKADPQTQSLSASAELVAPVVKSVSADELKPVLIRR